MIEFYPDIRAVHIAAVLSSGTLFMLRGLLVLSRGRALAQWAPLRYLSYAIDTVLLTAALMLVSILPAAVFANHWLLAKLALLPLYIVLASIALKRAKTTPVQLATYLLAVAVFAGMLSIARTHQPWGHLSILLGRG